jgi:4-amino-4-deoxy-L-arabinose transferase-like glycosyltransferase
VARLRDGWSRVELRWLAAILVLATALRVAWVLYVDRPPQGLHDPLFYFLYATQIADGNGYRLLDGSPTAYYPIGYPAALGAVYALVKHTPIPDNLVLASGFFNVFLGVATVALGYAVARRLFNTSVGLLSALWLAVFPNLIFHTGTFLSETLFNFLIMASLLVLLADDWRERPPSRARMLTFGAVLGLSALVRPISLLFLPIVAIVWWYAGFGWRRALESTGLALVMAAAVIAPWTIRNIVVMKSFVVISTNLGDDLCMGHYPGAYGGFSLPVDCFDPSRYAGVERPGFETRRNDDNMRRAIRFAVHHPRGELKLLSSKSWYLWAKGDHDGLWAVESYGDDPFIRTRLSLQIVPGQVPDDRLPAIAAKIESVAGIDAAQTAGAVKAGKAAAPDTPVVIAERIAPEPAYEIKASLLPGVRLVTHTTAAWTALVRSADIFYYTTISLGALGLFAFVQAPRDPRRTYFVLALLAFAGVPLVFFGDARFHVPALPLLAVGASWVVVFAWRSAPKLIAKRQLP